MVHDEMAMLQKLHHKHIVEFVEWFESKVCAYPSHRFPLLI